MMSMLTRWTQYLDLVSFENTDKLKTLLEPGHLNITKETMKLEKKILAFLGGSKT